MEPHPSRSPPSNDLQVLSQARGVVRSWADARTLLRVAVVLLRQAAERPHPKRLPQEQGTSSKKGVPPLGRLRRPSPPVGLRPHGGEARQLAGARGAGRRWVRRALVVHTHRFGFCWGLPLHSLAVLDARRFAVCLLEALLFRAPIQYTCIQFNGDSHRTSFYRIDKRTVRDAVSIQLATVSLAYGPLYMCRKPSAFRERISVGFASCDHGARRRRQES